MRNKSEVPLPSVMLLADVLAGIVAHASLQEVLITGLTQDSCQVQPGVLFLAYPGQQADGRDFMQQAATAGARAILAEADDQKVQVTTLKVGASGCSQQRIPLIYIPGLRSYVSELAARYYQHPSAQMRMLGVTGTNGKSSCVHFLIQGLQTLNVSSAMIGTLGYGQPAQLRKTQLTTPDAVRLQSQLAELRDEGAEVVAMEVSSHALAQDRCRAVHFDTAVFTNLSRDHLDYHGDMASYGQAKEKLMHTPGLRTAVINIDDAYGAQMITRLADKGLQMIGVSTEGQVADGAAMLIAEDITMLSRGFSCSVKSPWGSGELRSEQLLGRFNVTNLLLSLGAMMTLDIPFDKALSSLSKVTAVPGRMQAFGGIGGRPLVVVDYAHTPAALEAALKSLREHAQGKLWCVFGCGGDRDKGKRKLMGQVAEKYSDQLLITDDNARSEDPEAIVNDICDGVICKWAVEVIHDRSGAIASAVRQAEAEDIILVAGRGHETHQQVGDKAIPLSDVEQVMMNLNLGRLPA